MRTGLLPRGAFNLVFVAICLELLVSANLLTWLGIPYVTDGGFFLFKFHPGTLCLLLAAGLTLAGSRPLAGRTSALAVFFAFAGLNILYVFLLTGPTNLIVLLDTFLPAGLLAVVLSRAPAPKVALLRRTMQAALTLNALLALVETARQSTLVPLYLNDAAYMPRAEDFRPTALFDHPLTGALMMMMGLSLAPIGKWGLPFQSLLWLGLIAFGGRMAIAVTLTSMLGLAGLANARLLLLRDKRAIRTTMFTAVATICAAILAAAALSAGFGERLVGHLYWDESAQVRLAQWRVLGRLDVSQLIFGTPREQLLANLNVLRLDDGVEVIENFWLLMFVSTGLLGFPTFIAMLSALCAWCWQRSGTDARVLLISVLIVASSSNSLGRKSTVLVCLVAAISCVQPRPARMQVRHHLLLEGLPA